MTRPVIAFLLFVVQVLCATPSAAEGSNFGRIPGNQVAAKAIGVGSSLGTGGTTYYVDSVGGSDGSNGTSVATPWKTLSNVDSTVFSPGDQILLARGGTWDGQLHPLGSGSAQAPIVLGAYGSGPAPVIDGGGLSQGTAVGLLNQQYWTIEDLDIVNNSNSTNFGTLLQPGVSRDGILIEDNGGGVLAGITVTGNSISNVNGCFNCSDVDSHLNGGIVVESLSTGDSFNGVDIDGNTVNNVGRSGIVFWDQSYYASNPFEVDQPELSTGILVNNNSLTKIDGDGIIVLGAYASIISNNVVADASQKSIAGSSEAASVGIMTTRSIGAVVEHNEVYGTLTQTTDGEGFDVDLGSTDTTVQYNYSHDNEGGFLLMMGGVSSGLITRYNLSVNDSYGGLKGVFTFDSSQSDSQIYNNTVYIPPGTKENPILCQNCSSGVVTSWSFVNNIVDNFGNGSYVYPSSSTITVESNDFFGNHPSGEPNDPQGLLTDPQLVSPGASGNGFAAAQNYLISPSSPAYSAGSKVTGNGGLDFFGDAVPGNSAPSVGFDQPGQASGYWLLSSTGTVYQFGNAGDFGCICGSAGAKAISPTADGKGYRTATQSGEIQAFGDAASLAQVGPLGSPLVSLASTADGKGYWAAAQSGQVQVSGDAINYGSPVQLGLKLTAGIVDLKSTPDGKGYWELGADGGVFSFGDAGYFGSTGNFKLNSPVVAMAPTSSGNGYWLVASDGGVFSFGDAGYFGSIYQLAPGAAPGGNNSVAPLKMPIVGLIASADGKGYWMAAADGGVFNFGDAPFAGSLGAGPIQGQIVAFAAD